MGLMVIYYGFNDGKFHGFSPKFSENFRCLANLRMAVLIHPDLWGVVEEVQQAHGFIPRPLPSSSRCLESWWGCSGGGIDEGFIRKKKAAKKPGALYGKLRFSRDETLFGYKTKMVLLSRILFWKTNMFKNGWRLAITDFVRTGVFLWDWVDSSFCWISLMI